MTPPPERNGHPAPADVQALRASSRDALAQGRWHTKRSVSTGQTSGVELLRVSPEGDEPRARMIHFHGGGFRIGLPEMDAPFTEMLADQCGIEVILPRYRLAPEHPFPAALNDALAVLAAVPADLPQILSGASAGGGLAAGLALRARDTGHSVSGLLLHSPWLDLTDGSPAYGDPTIDDPLFTRQSAITAAHLYLQGHPASDPLASPLFADLTGLPPTMISVGTGEFLYDNATRFHASLEAAGVVSRLLAIDGMEHVAITRTPDTPAARAVFEASAGFLESVIAASQRGEARALWCRNAG